MDEAAAIVASSLRVRYQRWPATESVPGAPQEHTTYLVLFDFIHTGATYRRLVTQARAAGYELHGFAVAGFVANDFNNDDAVFPRVYPVEQVVISRVERAYCPQCSLGLPFTEHYSEELIGLRAYDAWDILTSVDWRAERYGPPPHLRQKVLPNFEQIFKEVGDYIAYKLELVLRFVSPDAEVAVVCPDEPAIQSIISRMQPWADNRIAAVRLPREVLDLTDGSDPQDIRSLDAGSEWESQLRHLAERNAGVVLTDEFNGSNMTARKMIKVIRAFHIYPRAYTPIFNFAPAEVLDGIRVVALYDLPNPRELSR
jgi:hypothetical protein